MVHPLLALLDAGGIDFSGQAVVGHGAAVEKEGGAFVVAAAVVGPVGEDDLPRRSQIFHDLPQILKVVAQFDEGDEIELANDLSDVVERGVPALLLAELPDVPDSDIDGLVELGGRNLGCSDSRLQCKEPSGNFGGYLTVVHQVVY